MKNKTIIVPILNDEYKVVIIWGSKKYISKTAKRFGYKPFYGDSYLSTHLGVTYRESGKFPMIILKKQPRAADSIGALSHEAYHAIMAICAAIQEENPGEEIVAHGISAVVRWALK